MAQTEWLTEREERAWRALQFMQLRLEGALARQLAAESGLSYPDYLVLVALTDSPTAGCVSSSSGASWAGRRAACRTTSVAWSTGVW